MKQILRVIALLCVVALPSVVRASFTVKFYAPSGTSQCFPAPTPTFIDTTFSGTTCGSGSPTHIWTVAYTGLTGTSVPGTTVYTSAPSTSTFFITALAGGIFNTNGYYSVTEEVICGTDTESATQVNYVYHAPVPTLSFTTTNPAADTVLTCGPRTIKFVNTSTDTNACANNWVWTVIGPEGPSAVTYTYTTSGFTQTFATPGNYSVRLSSSSACGCIPADVFRDSMIKIQANPVACFSYDSTAYYCSAPATVTFTNCSSGATHYTWLYGDNTTGVSAVHTYTAAGTYTDTLIAYSSAGCQNQIIGTSSIVVHNIIEHIRPSSMINPGGIDTICQNTTHTYSDSGSTYPVGTSLMKTWNAYDATGMLTDGPNGGSTYMPAPFILPGTYKVVLTVMPAGHPECSVADSHYVYVRPAPVVSDFIEDSVYRCSPTIHEHFTALGVSGVGPFTYHWHFDNNAADTSDLASPAFNYTATGTFTPSVVIKDVHGCTDSIVSSLGPIKIGPPTVHLTLGADSGCYNAGIHVSWRDTSNLATSFAAYLHTDSITFSDHTPSCIGNGCADSSATVFDSGYVVVYHHWSLPAWLGGCSGIDSSKILIGGSHPSGHIGIALSGTHACVHDTVRLTTVCPNCTFVHWNVSTGNGTSQSSDTSQTTVPFPYPSSVAPLGCFDVQLVLDAGGCIDTADTCIHIYGPIVPGNVNVTVPNCAKQDSFKYTASYLGGAPSDITKYIWGFHYPVNHRDTTTAPTNFDGHNFTAAAPPGYYYDTLTIVGNAGDSGCVNRVISSVIIDSPLHFSIDSVVCIGLPDTGYISTSLVDTTHFTYSLIWHWGDGTSYPGVGDNPSVTSVVHTYSADSIYRNVVVIHNRYNATCLDTVGAQNVHVVGPHGSITATPDPTCAPFTPVHLVDVDADVTGTAITHRFWTVTNASTSATVTTVATGSVNNTNVYIPEGTFVVTVNDTDSHGCANQYTDTIVGLHQHAYFYSADSSITACIGLPVPFHDTNTHVKYSWNFGDAPGYSAPSATAHDTTHAYAANGTYSVTVIIYGDGTNSPVGCPDTFTRTAYIHVAPVPVAITPTYGLSANCSPFFFFAQNTSPGFVSSDSVVWRLYHTPIYQFGTTLYNHTGSFYGTGAVTDTSGNTVDNWGPHQVLADLDATGSYYVTLIVATSYGCVDSLTDTIHVDGPQGILAVTNLSPSNCAPVHVESIYTDTGHVAASSSNEFIWLYTGSGSDVNNAHNDYYTYNTPGVYPPPQLLIEDPTSGCAFLFPSADSIHVYPVPVVTVTSSPTICYGSFVTLNASGAATYAWSPATALSCTNCATTNASPVSTTSYAVVGANTYGCKDTAHTTVNVLAPVVVHISGRDSVCFGQADTLIVTGLPDYHYVWDSTPGISCAVCDTTYINTLSTEIYTVVATNSAGCTGSDSFKVTINPIPVVTANPNPIAVCARMPSPQVNASGAATYEWKPLSGLSCYDCPSPFVSLTSSLIYTLTGTSQYGCSDSAFVPAVYYDTVATSVVPADTTICFGDSIQLRAFGGTKFTWLRGVSSISDTSIYDPWVKPLSTTLYEVEIFENVCFHSFRFANVNVIPTPVITPMASSTIIAGNSVQLNAVVTNDPITNFVWTPADTTLSCLDCSSPIATPTATTTYSVTVITSQGCHSSADVTIHLICDNSQVFIPNTFTPNGDGVNDHFFISGKGLGLIKHMAVYNRWGELMFEGRDFNANDPGMGWDGTFRGEVLRPDVYIYVVDVLCETGDTFTFRGDISLVK